MRNWNIFCAVLLVLFICSSNFSLIEAQDKIEGPWYWLIVDTSKKGGGAAVTKDDWIKEVTGGVPSAGKVKLIPITNKNGTSKNTTNHAKGTI